MPEATPIMTGYYRYTGADFANWPDLLRDDQRDPLKAVLAHDSLVHSENPLHVEGVDGASMFMGTFHDGQQRLLFSSAQVDYVRYWLHAMQLTKDIIPLPYSECLLIPSGFSNVSPVVYKDGGSLRNALKHIEKNNKRLKNSNPKLLARRDAFERVRKYWATKSGTWCALDFEDWEMDHSVITEFGYKSIHWENGKEVEDMGHFTVKEYDSYRNGKTLKKLQAPLDDAVFDLPEAVPTQGIFIVDTAVLFAALIGQDNNKPGLKQACNQLQIQTDYLHNAGNDAFYTLSVLHTLASGGPLDTQREIRWPNRTGAPGTNSGVKVNFEAYEEDSDFSDQEDGAKGIQAYIGTFHDGQARLLFSSAQVDYLRYWMQAMKLTEHLIPLPYSDCMFLESSLATVAPTVFESLGALGATSKKLGRMNQSLKEKPLLVPRRATFERVRTLWNAQKGVWCALNFAAWEVDHTAISDIGWSLIRWESGTEVADRAHLVVEGNQKYKKTELQDGGEHEMVTKVKLKQKITDLFSRLGQHAPIFLVSNDSSGDLKYLRSNAFQISLSDLVLELPETMPSAGVFIVEPAELFDALTGSGDPNIDYNLKRICKHLEIDFGPVRNGGTDAECMLQALRSMASGPQLDAQREERWPDQTKSEVEVELGEWDNDPQCADLEAIFPPQKPLT
ncbi:hypothetical protein MVEN_01237000 [Mycena venus]|uniref:Gfd2/YDR514C-like C-terminal domain-containing protein n=1 Tax=Mycena venus TaxID=2733690 RepID=A0A8H6Y277_9AGAR|nr:hypothetical protein MVEN_01237000 [Mycena venus]